MRQTFVTALTLATAIGMTAGCGASGPEMSSPAGPTSPGIDATSSGAGAPVKRDVPSAADRGAPFYTPVFIDGLSGFVPTDGTWVGIHFIREPSCIPPTFNLLQVFHPLVAPDCTLTITGQTWRHGPDDRVPYQEHYSGVGAVPIYFVRLADLQAAAADGMLTIAELTSIAVIGRADSYRSVIHHSTQAANHGHETLTAHGWLENGRRFQFHFDEKFLDGRHVFQSMRIEFQ